MTEDPREHGLTAADLRAAADRLYPADDPRLVRIEWANAQARYGQIRSRLRSLADALEAGTSERGKTQSRRTQHGHRR